jgi:hypothetical protein
MGIEYHNGFPYYYEKRREGRKVISVYAGSGMIALLNQEIAQQQAEAEAARRSAFEQKRKEIQALDREIDGLLKQVFALSDAALIASGYHKHKRQWRKRRNDDSNKHRT